MINFSFPDLHFSHLRNTFEKDLFPKGNKCVK